jgi:tetratricopeptide (TPR) repeat protein
LVANQQYEPALAIYRAIPPRSQIIATQAYALDAMRKELKILETRAEADKAKPANQRSKAPELINSLKPAIKVAEDALKAVEEKADLDSAILMRRGRCLFYLDRNEEALVCFRTLRTKYGSSVDAKSAAFAEIVILNKLQDIAGIKEMCELYMRKYPDAENIEQVATLAGEVLVQGGNWKEVGAFYRGLETKFPKSDNLDRFVFFQALATFQEGRFAEAAPMIAKLRALNPPPKNSTPSSELLNETRFSITVPEPAPPVVSDWSSLLGASSKPEKRIWLKRNEPELSAELAPPNGVAIAAPSRRPSQVALAVGLAVVLKTPVEQSECGARPSSTTPPHCCWLLSLARPMMLSRLVQMIGRSAVPFDWIALPRFTTR